MRKAGGCRRRSSRGATVRSRSTARGYPPSDVPEDPEAYSQQQAADDIKGSARRARHRQGARLRALDGRPGHAAFQGSANPDRALSLVVAGRRLRPSDDPEGNRKDFEQVARRFETEGMEKTGEFYARGPSRVQLLEKDPVGWQEFHDRLCPARPRDNALTMRGVQMRRPTIYSLEERLAKLEVPTLIVTGDEDEPCLEPALFMKRRITRLRQRIGAATGPATARDRREEIEHRAVERLRLLEIAPRGRTSAARPARAIGILRFMNSAGSRHGSSSSPVTISVGTSSFASRSSSE